MITDMLRRRKLACVDEVKYLTEEEKQSDQTFIMMKVDLFIANTFTLYTICYKKYILGWQVVENPPSVSNVLCIFSFSSSGRPSNGKELQGIWTEIHLSSSYLHLYKQVTD